MNQLKCKQGTLRFERRVPCFVTSANNKQAMSVNARPNSFFPPWERVSATPAKMKGSLLHRALLGYWQPGYHSTRKHLRPYGFAPPSFNGFPLTLFYIISFFSHRLHQLHSHQSWCLWPGSRRHRSNTICRRSEATCRIPEYHLR